MNGIEPALTELTVYQGDKPASISTKHNSLSWAPASPGVGLWKRGCGLQEPLGASSTGVIWWALTLLSAQVHLQGFAGRWTCRSSAWTEESPAVSLLQDWSRHPQGTKGVGAGDTPDGPRSCRNPAPLFQGRQKRGRCVGSSFPGELAVSPRGFSELPAVPPDAE